GLASDGLSMGRAVSGSIQSVATATSTTNAAWSRTVVVGAAGIAVSGAAGPGGSGTGCDFGAALHATKRAVEATNAPQRRTSAARRREVLIVGRARPLAAPRPTHGRERAGDVAPRHRHPGPVPRPVEIRRTGGRQDFVPEHVRVLDRVHVDRLAVGMDR